MKALIGFEKEFKIISNNLIKEKLNNSVLISGNKGIGKYFFITKIIEECINLKVSIGIDLFDDFKILLEKIKVKINQSWPKGKGERKLLGIIWSYLALAGDINVKRNCVYTLLYW